MVFNVASPFNYLPSFSILFSREERKEEVEKKVI